MEAEKIIYGKSEAKRSIENVVSFVFNKYKYCSLPEWNAALKQYNVVADRGKEAAIPASKIAALSSGEFVGLVADNPDEKIKLKMFHAEIINETGRLKDELAGFQPIPIVSQVIQQQVMDNFYQVKMDVKRLIAEEVERLKLEETTKTGTIKI